jgi:tRNA modification GTPase
VFAADDTIVAIATPHGRGGIGIVRLSGPQAVAITDRLIARSEPLAPRVATFTRVHVRPPVRIAEHEGPGGNESEGDARPIDQAIVTWFPAPKSYTGEDVVEVSVHGSPVVLHAVVRQAMTEGARLARPGEFTLRAFLNGKRDLVQAEAVGDLIEAATPLQARVAYDQLEGTLTLKICDIDQTLLDLQAKLEASIDFPDEGYRFIDPAEIAGSLATVDGEIARLLLDAHRGRTIREGATVVVVGKPNVGKSSIFNRLAGHDRAIVSAVPGTTRDMVTERVDLEGLAITVVDTAGAHDALDVVEREGVARGRRAREVADLLLVVLDQSEPATVEDEEVLAQTAARPRVVIANKADRPPLWRPCGVNHVVPVSTLDGTGMPELRRRILEALTGGESLRDGASVSNLRHISLLEEAQARVHDAHMSAAAGASEEFVIADVAAARRSLGEISGAGADDDVLARIFERFCVGK